NGTTTWSDQPLVSVDGKDIYVSTNQFTASGAYKASALTVVDDGLYAPGGSSALISAAQYANASYQPAAIPGGGEYLTSYTYNSLSIFQSIPGSGNSNPITVSLGKIDYGSSSYSASQLGTRFQLDAGDGRITGSAYDAAHQKLYVVFEVQPHS